MILTGPFVITPRLLPGVRIGGAWVQLERTRDVGAYGKPVHRWTIDLPDGSEHTGEDLCGREGLQGMFGSLLAFLGACADGYGYTLRTGRESESVALFPSAVAEWAYQHSDEIDSLRVEIEEAGLQLIQE